MRQSNVAAIPEGTVFSASFPELLMVNIEVSGKGRKPMAKNAEDSRIMEQKDMVRQLNIVISSQNELIASLRSTVEECNSTIAGLREQVEYLTGKLFGPSSEKSKNIAGQLNLFNETEQEAKPLDEAQESETVTVKEHTRQAKRTSDEIFKGVPSRDGVLPISEDQKHCSDCGTEMEVIGKEFVRREFRFTPANSLNYSGIRCEMQILIGKGFTA